MRIAFETQGDHRQGMGDLWGSVALAGACSRMSHETLVMIPGGEEAVALLQERGQRFHVVESREEGRQVLSAFRPDVVIVNKLRNEPDDIRWLKRFAALVVTMDDDGEGAQAADLRINALYPTASAVTDLRYLPLRTEFEAASARPRMIREAVQELLLIQGGSDTYGFTPRIIRALNMMTIHPHCTVVIGPAFRHERELQQAIAAASLSLSVVRNAPHMATLMIQVDLAITAGGLTMCELVSVGTPSLVICGEPFELPTARRLEAAGVVRVLGFGGDLDDAQVPRAVERLAEDLQARRHMSATGRQLIDGYGCERIVQLIEARLAGDPSRIRSLEQTC